MRKDFLVDPVQVDEARAAGASGVLLIVAMLDDTGLRAMLDRSLELGMFVLLEAFDREDLVRMRRLLAPADLDAASSGRLLFGVNSRNLRTLAVDADRLGDFVADLPRGPRVAESGLATAEDAERVARYGYSMALVGTALMRSADPAGLIGAMRSAGMSGIAA
jgi:indole-3-glycerol phosphate synthase